MPVPRNLRQFIAVLKKMFTGMVTPVDPSSLNTKSPPRKLHIPGSDEQRGPAHSKTTKTDMLVD